MTDVLWYSEKQKEAVRLGEADYYSTIHPLQELLESQRDAPPDISRVIGEQFQEMYEPVDPEPQPGRAALKAVEGE